MKIICSYIIVDLFTRSLNWRGFSSSWWRNWIRDQMQWFPNNCLFSSVEKKAWIRQQQTTNFLNSYSQNSTSHFGNYLQLYSWQGSHVDHSNQLQDVHLCSSNWVGNLFEQFVTCGCFMLEIILSSLLEFLRYFNSAVWHHKSSVISSNMISDV